MEELKLFIICGHGESDPGACGNGYKEAERVRALAERIKVFGGERVVVGDTTKNWYKGNLISSLNVSKEHKILELHMDASSNPSAKGGHVIIKEGFKADKWDEGLADLISEMFPGYYIKISKRGDLANPKRAAQKGYNYRLLECGFITNKDNLNTFNTKMDELAKGILEVFDIPVVTKTEPSEPSKTETPSTTGTELKVGDVVNFTGNTHYTSSYPAGKVKTCKPGLATVTEISKGQPHPYLLKAVSGKGSTVHGWVNVEDIQGITPVKEEKEDKVDKTEKVESIYYGKYTGFSGRIDEILKEIGVPAEYIGSWRKRHPIASANGIENYTGTITQNLKIISLAKSGKLKKV